MSKHLDQIENQSLWILREAFAQVPKIVLLWSLGKDSNVMVHLIRKAFLGKVPFPALHVDTGKKFREMYAFRDKYEKEWGIKLLRQECPPIESIDDTLPPAARSSARKTEGLRTAIKAHKFKGIIAGIRRDEDPTRAKERVFSLRDASGRWDVKNQPPEIWGHYNTRLPEGKHLRIHPILHWTEIDIWQYIQQESIPVVSLYFAKNGKRYRSLGDKDLTFPVSSTAKNVTEIIQELKITQTSERSGRAVDAEEEDSFERLRASGYM